VSSDSNENLSSSSTVITISIVVIVVCVLILTGLYFYFRSRWTDLSNKDASKDMIDWIFKHNADSDLKVQVNEFRESLPRNPVRRSSLIDVNTDDANVNQVSTNHHNNV
jgi:hypothetical protein